MSDPCKLMLHSVLSAICRKTKTPKITLDPQRDLWLVEVEGRDKGRAIGRNGQTAWALTTLAWYAGYAHGQIPCRVQMEGEAPKQPSSAPFKINPDWDRKLIGAMLDTIFEVCLKRRIPWAIEETAPGTSTVLVQMDAYLKTSMCDPSFEEALSIVVHSAAASDGADLKTSIEWK